MLRFNQVPPTAETTDVEPSLVRFLAYGIGDHYNLRCINGVAEVCASIVYQTADNFADIMAIGEKIGDTIAHSEESKYPEADAGGFVYRYAATVQALGQKAAKTFVGA